MNIDNIIMASMVMDSISNGLVLSRTSAVDNQCDFFHSCIQIRYGISSNSFTEPFQEKIALYSRPFYSFP